GITGVGIALDAAARGLSVALVEKDDFAAGTSGRSSRLVHGGLRYLEQRDFGLVRESLRERGILYRLAPHLVRPVPMYMLAGDRLANHARVTGLLGGGRVTGATVADETTGQGFEVRARAVVNATGIWAERVAQLAPGSGGVRLRPSKGVHLVFAPGAVRTTA